MKEIIIVKDAWQIFHSVTEAVHHHLSLDIVGTEVYYKLPDIYVDKNWNLLMSYTDTWAEKEIYNDAILEAYNRVLPRLGSFIKYREV